MNILRLAATAAILAAAPLACGASTLTPSQPSAFDLVNLRMTVDDCAFNMASVNVAMANNVITLTHQPNNCLVAGSPIVVDVRLGSFPVGSYRVNVYASATPMMGMAVESIAFEVRGRPEIAIFPPPPHPITDYSGVWYNPAESGWGVSFHQGAGNSTFAMLFVYSGSSQPEWYSIQGGRWTSTTTWTGTIYRTTGPSLSLSVFDPRLVAYFESGTAGFDFKQTPGTEGKARFSYSIGGASATKTVQRMPL
jgi:hypothetical protein